MVRRSGGSDVPPGSCGARSALMVRLPHGSRRSVGAVVGGYPPGGSGTGWSSVPPVQVRGGDTDGGADDGGHRADRDGGRVADVRHGAQPREGDHRADACQGGQQHGSDDDRLVFPVQVPLPAPLAWSAGAGLDTHDVSSGRAQVMSSWWDRAAGSWIAGARRRVSWRRRAPGGGTGESGGARYGGPGKGPRLSTAAGRAVVDQREARWPPSRPW